MTTRELIERAREALESCTPGDYSTGHVIHPYFDEALVDAALADIDAHLSEPQQTTLPVEIYGKLYDVPIPVQVHIVSLGVQIKQADERGDEALRRAHECERLAEIAQPDDRKALAEGVHPVVHETLQRECDRLINERDAALAKLAQPYRKALADRLYDCMEQVLAHYRGDAWVDESGDPMPLVDVLTPAGSRSIAEGRHQVRLICDAIYNDPDWCAALAAQPVQEPAGDAQPWRPFGLTLEAALNRGDDPALLMDENSPLRGELRRLLYAPLAPPTAPVEQPAQAVLSVKLDEWQQLSPEGQSKLEKMTGWICSKCGTDRCKAACPLGHNAALTGQCPMVGVAQAAAPSAQPTPTGGEQ